MYAAYFISFSTGFLSLGLEVLWVRLFAFTNHSMPQAFAFVLATYLVGIAIGAQLGKLFCHSSRNLWLVSGVTLMISSCADWLSPWVYAAFAHTDWQIGCGGLLIVLTAALKATIFPIVHHLGTPRLGSSIGRAVSRVYVANILGATLGPFFIGVLLLSVFTTQQCFLVCAGCTFLLAEYCLLSISRLAILGVSLVAAWVALSVSSVLDSSLLMSIVADPLGTVKQIVENQYGIVMVYHGDGSDVVTGGNVYDGRTNLDPVVNSNGINRILIMSALHSHPQRVLIVGLSIGSWLKIMTTFPDVRHIDVIEINPGYLKAIQAYPRQASALSDPRVHLHIDDGRRWLKTHTNNSYDMVIMNTTYYWRAYTANLLSYEFLSLIKQHMRTNAVMAFNSTWSIDALKTATVVFNHAYLYDNFVIAADFDWRHKLHDKAAVQRLASLRMDGELLFPPHSEVVIAGYLQRPITTLNSIEATSSKLGRQFEVVTDRNLITEYKYGWRLWGPHS